jgi:hypothetical protein
MRSVDARESEHRKEHQNRQRKQRVDQLSITQALVIEVHGKEHGRKAYDSPDGLLDEVVIRISVLLISDDGGGAVNHDNAKERQPCGRRKQPSIRL